jgi:poly-gamma-glutamate synthesis protein (capsule biosynthesis protein)
MMKSYYLLAAFIFVLTGCGTNRGYEQQRRAASHDSGTVTMLAVGDNLIHDVLITAAANVATANVAAATVASDNTAANSAVQFDFRPFYSEVRDIVRAADIAFINQETPIAGEKFGYSGYPTFNGPDEIGEAIVWTGFDVVNSASNHTMDKGGRAVHAVIDYWKTKPQITILGIHESELDRNTNITKNIITVKNIKIGFLSYTYGLNGIPLPKNEPYLVSLIDKNVMAVEIDKLRPLCDFLVVSMHWGNEYEHKPSKTQEDLAAFLAAHDVDLVIGHHPHVLQPVRKIKKADGGDMLVYFSLGNFLSAQNEAPRMLGGMMRISIKREKESKKIIISSAELIPLVTHYESGGKNFKVYLLQNYNDVLMLLHSLYGKARNLSLSYFNDLTKNIFGDSIFDDYR